ncbi:UDP-3-O-(3-hydroxymyristoyl)glucosamine N-acyltransferase [uncultured Desulfosarcina sp.]|uniref:UDP-3-O-(3-hydroxymyristoyl)glucosamine N-acyltransferase n=1 Tax=uncultured Desulfosarcina sp. TaxID=218289 RepID=UPI0029C96070|nr:UDP-3-O-(3-hydroxymyristoyl)glucosamine N-acyltransferase [uncultured Desulfosarcina sp.]
MPVEYTLEEIARRIDGETSGNEEMRINGVAPFDAAGATQITFAGGSKFLKRMDACQAGAIIVPEKAVFPGRNLIHVSNPQLAFNGVVALFHPSLSPPAGIDEKAAIGKDVCTGKDIFIGPLAHIGNRVTIGSGTIVHAGVFIGDEVKIGERCVIHPNATIMHGCCIGDRVTIHPGTVIGSDGYGFVPDGGRYHKIPQIGIVQIDDDVEIGACNTIDRATFGRTWIQRGVKTDNLVHIAHNVVIGEDSVIVAQVGIAGSTKIGHHAILAGQAGISGHLELGNHVTVGPMTGVGKSIPDGEVVSSGTNAMPHRTWLRVQHIIPSLPDMKKKVADLEKKLADLEKSVKKESN